MHLSKGSLSSQLKNDLSLYIHPGTKCLFHHFPSPFNHAFVRISDIIHTAEYQTAQRNTYRSSDTFPFLLFKKPGKAFNLGKINGWSSDYHHPFIPSVTRAVCVCARQLGQSTSNSGPSVKRRWGPSLRETNDLSHVIDHLPMGHLSFLCLARCNPPSFSPPSPVAWWRKTAGECRQIVEKWIYIETFRSNNKESYLKVRHL